jgi:hypothetical protein
MNIDILPVSDGFAVEEDVLALPLAICQGGRPNGADDELRIETTAVDDESPTRNLWGGKKIIFHSDILLFKRKDITIE